MARVGVRAAAGLVAGTLAGVVVTLGVVVARARLERVFLHEVGDVVGWTGLGLVLGPAAALWLALAAPAALASTAAGAGVGLLLGAGLGAAAGALGSPDPAWAWAGGTMGAAAGLLAGALAGYLRGRRLASRTGTASAAALATLTAVAALGSAACSDGAAPALPAPGRFSDPAPGEVESVIFFLGDPGLARADRSPILSRVREEVERWADALDGDSTVVAVILGDLVYPDGVAEREARGFAEDSARVADQVALVAGPAARRRGARLYMLPGNHDWGDPPSREGAVRLHRLDGLLRELRPATGAAARLEPRPGTGGPAVVDVGAGVRLVLLDTAWWLLDGEPAERARVVDAVRRALRTAGSRHVVMAAHHPFESAGRHGTLYSFGEMLGIRTLLSRSGALLQDLSSAPYRELRQELGTVFAEEGRPPLFAGGHDHSLQVIRGRGADAPAMSLVSGSASKLTRVGSASGLAFGAAVPGYARLFVKRDGSLELRLDAAPARYLECPGDGPRRAACVEEGVAAYRTVWAGEVPVR